LIKEAFMTSGLIRILLIDDQPLTAKLLSRMLADQPDLELHYCSDPQEAILTAQRVMPAVVLMDLVMPGIDGIMLLKRFRELSQCCPVPIVMLSTTEEPDTKAKAFLNGANDYLIKLPDKLEIIARLRYHAESYFNAIGSRKAENKYRKLFEHSRDAIFLTDVETERIIDCNDAATHLMAMPRDRIIGMYQPELHAPHDARYYKSLFNQHIQFQKEITTEIYIQRPDGERIPVDVSAVMFEQEGHLYSQWMFQDISERKQLLKSLEEILSLAESANRAKSEFLATMSHEIRTPMNAVLGMAEALLETVLTDEQRRYVRIFNRAGETLLAIINDILDLSKIEAGQMELEPAPCSLLEVIDATLDVFGEQAQDKGVRLIDACDRKDLPNQIVADCLRLRQVLMNLLGNALKFTQQGEITLSARSARRPGEEGMILFSVQDTGIGIPYEKQGKIFAPFTQGDASTTRRFGGTGLGLTICRQLVEMMGGRIGVKSEEGQGSTFYFTVRVEIPKGEESFPDTNIVTGTPGSVFSSLLHRRVPIQPLRILLVDDAEDNRLLIDIFLKDTSHQLVCVENGQLAVDEHKKNLYDLILMDVQMPVMDGYTATRLIREWEQERRHTWIIALTAYAMQRDTERSLAAGCDMHLTKPLRKARLLEAIDSLIQKHA
jgi:PAS domain S-box-containing protein